MSNHKLLDYVFCIHLKEYPIKHYLCLDSLSTLSAFHFAIQDLFELDHNHPYRFYGGLLNTSHNWNGFPIISNPSSPVTALLKTRTLGELHLTCDSVLTYIYEPERKWVFHLTLLSITPFLGSHHTPALVNPFSIENNTSNFHQKLFK